MRDVQPAKASGTLILVVGASGAGKDTLVQWARAALSDRSIRFVEREITRVRTACDHHVAVTDAQFDQRVADHQYVLTWSAHGVRYGVPRAVADALNAGVSVVTIASRAVLDAARALPWPMRAIEIRAPYHVLQQRLLARDGRPACEIPGRLERASAIEVSGADVDVIDNGGALDESTKTFGRLLTELAAR